MKVVVFFIAEPEVQYSYNINGLKLVVPFTLKTLLSYRECGVIDAPVLEKLLLTALHLNKDFLATLILAIYIEHGTAVTLRRTQMLGVEILQITNNLSATKQTVDETYQKLLVYLGTEKHLKPEICIRIDISVAGKTVFNHSSMY